MEKSLKPTHDSPTKPPPEINHYRLTKAAVIVSTRFALKIGLTSSSVWELLGHLKIRVNIGGPRFELRIQNQENAFFKLICYRIENLRIPTTRMLMPL